MPCSLYTFDRDLRIPASIASTIFFFFFWTALALALSSSASNCSRTLYKQTVNRLFNAVSNMLEGRVTGVDF
jgi:hypothetical protein